MSMAGSILQGFGVAQMPWVVRAYLILLAVFAVMVVLSAYLSWQWSYTLTAPLSESHPISKFFGIASNGLKTVLGAVIGSLSLAASRDFGPARNGERQISRTT